MAVLLVLLTFLFFIALDYFLKRREAIRTVGVEAKAVPIHLDVNPVGLGANYVGGFLVPHSVSYHPGHSWLIRERQNQARVGADEFAAALLGKVEKIELPRPGQWIRQGQKVVSFYKDGEKTAMVSPTEGEVMEINTEVAKNPALLRQDPYGKGWLMSVNVPDEENTGRNLVPAKLVADWMREAIERLYARQPQLAGAVAADGGRPAESLLEALPDVSWKEVTGEFLLTGRGQPGQIL